VTSVMSSGEKTPALPVNLSKVANVFGWHEFCGDDGASQ
jgi:hypothetical protein